MKQINLGATSLKIPAMELGIMRMEAKTPAEAAKAVDTAFDHGINFIDSADIYGQSKSEEVLGQALKLSNANRTDLFIQSKVGIIVDPARSNGSFVFGSRYEFTKQHILEAVDGILKRMGTDYLDGLLLHRPDPATPIEETAEALDQLVREGKALNNLNFTAGELAAIDQVLATQQ